MSSESRSITGIFIFIGILLFAVWLGVSIITDQIKTLAYVAAGTTIIMCALLGKRIWLIIPLATALNFTLMISGMPDTLLIAQILFVGFSTLLFLSRRLPFRFQFTELEFWILLLCLCIGQVYLRNPVGLNIFGSGSVGARPYAIFGISLLTSIIMCGLRVPTKDLRWFMRLSIIGGIINFCVSTFGHFVPRIGAWYGVAGSIAPETNFSSEAQYGVTDANRIGFLGVFARNISLWISSFKSPIRACFHPLWAPLVLLSFACAALSGFRNEIIAVGLTYLIGIAYRGGFVSVVIACFTLIFALVFLAIVNSVTPLPANIQRSLSFLPGTWENNYVKDAKGSTEWRVDMWKEALLTKYWIKNKILGDGLGMTREQLNFISSLEGQNINAKTDRGGLSLQQQTMMAAGAYHSGPVSSVRTVGYVGLLILLLAQIRLAVHAHRQIKRTRNTEWFPLALLIGIPIIWNPIFFVFVFGDFGKSISVSLMAAAVLRILENNLPLPKQPIRGKDGPSKIGNTDSIPTAV